MDTNVHEFVLIRVHSWLKSASPRKLATNEGEKFPRHESPVLSTVIGTSGRKSERRLHQFNPISAFDHARLRHGHRATEPNFFIRKPGSQKAKGKAQKFELCEGLRPRTFPTAGLQFIAADCDGRPSVN